MNDSTKNNSTVNTAGPYLLKPEDVDALLDIYFEDVNEDTYKRASSTLKSIATLVTQQLFRPKDLLKLKDGGEEALEERALLQKYEHMAIAIQPLTAIDTIHNLSES